MPPTDSADQPLLAPARYIGEHTLRISRQHGAVHAAADPEGTKGERRDGGLLRPGDALLLPASEVYGQSYLYDPRGERDPLYLGVGRCVLPEHAALSEAELAALGYEFHGGRSDFEPVKPFAAWYATLPPAEPPAELQTPSDAAAAPAKGRKVAAAAAEAQSPAVDAAAADPAAAQEAN